MATLTLTFKEKQLSRHPVGGNAVVAIGRRSSNDIVIVNLLVSGYHAEVVPGNDRYVLRDLNSKNGTRVNGKPVTVHPLADGDVITIGKHDLVFSIDDEALSDTELDSLDDTLVFEDPTEILDKTVVIDTSRLHHGQAGRKDAGKSSPATLLTGNDRQERIPLNRQLVRIGTLRDSDIRITGFSRWFAGKTCATISKRPDGYYISYVSGLIRPKINNTPLAGTVKLNESDTIRIGPLHFQFTQKKF